MMSWSDRPAPVIQVQRVTKVYDLGQVKVRALREVSVRIDAGDFVAIMGSSGSGKSTLMNILGCLDIPTSGQYLLDGTDVSRLDDRQLALVRPIYKDIRLREQFNHGRIAHPASFRSRVAALIAGLKRRSSRQVSANFDGSG